VNLAAFVCSLAALLLMISGNVPTWIPATLLFAVAGMMAWTLRR